MKQIFKYILAAALVTGATSCESYFDVDTEQNIPTDEAFTSVQDVRNGMVGAYYMLGSYRFHGNYIIALGDMASDIATASSSTGHFIEINTYGVSETNAEITDMWDYGYKLVDICVRTIQGAEKVLNDKSLNLSEGDIELLNSCISQCYALRALSTFFLTNIYGLPYQPGQQNNQLGVCLLDKEPLKPFVKIDRSTVEQCYAQVLSDLSKAKEFYTGVFPTGTPQFYFNDAAIEALEARAYLYMGNYEAAEKAAKNAIEMRNSGNVSNEMYIKMWSSTAVTDEDIMTVAKSDNDNLSANALNTLYGSYKGTVDVKNYFGANDARAQLLSFVAYKFQGTSTSQATSNIPVFRKSEMYLIIAECEAMKGTVENAQDALFYTAKRNVDLTKEDLPATKDGLMSFIKDERVRELFQEGHRWYDARRYNLSLSSRSYKNFEVAKFVYPIPADEINAGFCTQQNENWDAALPQ